MSDSPARCFTPLAETADRIVAAATASWQSWGGLQPILPSVTTVL